MANKLVLPKFHDVKIVRRKQVERPVVVTFPPEQFGIARNATSARDSSYCFHEVLKTQAELIAEGFDPDQINNLTTYTGLENPEKLSRDTVDESQSGQGDSGLNKASREIQIIEHYVVLDYEGNGKACRYKVTTGGSPSQILRRKQDDGGYADDVVKWNGPPPFATACPVPMPHRFFGRSIADLVMDIQKIKTTLMRGLLNNLYLRVYPRAEVSESHAGVNTMDDLLTWRPNGVIRTKMPGGLNWQEVPDASPSVFSALQYLDAQREWRSGVTRQGQGVDPNALQNQVATIANQMEDASQAKVKMIARIIAETGLRDLFSLLHATIRRNGSVAQTVKLRGKWVNIDPRDWIARDDMTINVGLGTGSKMQQMAAIQLLMGVQEKAVQIGMVTRSKFYNTARELVRLVRSGGDVDTFFVNPSAPVDPNDPPIQPPEDPKKTDSQTKLLTAQAQGQAKLAETSARIQLEGAQARADMMTNNTKAMNEAALERQRATFEAQLSFMDHRLKAQTAQFQAYIKAMQARHQTVMRGLQMQMQMRAQQQRQNGRPTSEGY